MNEEFLSKGLGKNRYLKAKQLIEEFDRQVDLLLRSTGERIVEECDEMFSNPSPSERSGSSSSTFAYKRFEYTMSEVTTPEGDTPRLNVHLYWVHPSEYNRPDIDGVVRAFGYKVKDSGGVDDFVAEQTNLGDWTLNVAQDVFGSRHVFYRHLGSGSDAIDIQDELVHHFTEFADQWAQADLTD